MSDGKTARERPMPDDLTERLPEKVNKVLFDLRDYAYGIRLNWSDFDGRDLYAMICAWDCEARTAIREALDEAHLDGHRCFGDCNDIPGASA